MIRITVITAFFLASMGSALAATVPSSTIRCRRCEMATHTNNCTIFDTCNSSIEMCYMEEVMTDQLTVAYNGGCRARDVCMTGLGSYYVGRRSSPLVSCSRCCNNGDDCNKDLCAIPGRPSLSGMQTINCRRCEQANTKADCTYTVPCGPGEMCYMEEVVREDLTLIYNGGCRAADVCTKGSRHFVNRSPMISCSKCCNSSDDCNRDFCFLAGGVGSAPLVDPQHSMRCRQCESADTLDECVRLVVCGPGEMCYMDEVVTDQFKIVYNGGCRANDVCKAGSGHYVGTRSAVSCSKCCDFEDDCNKRLYDIKSMDLQASMCYTCGPGTRQPHLAKPEDCVTLNPCQSNEVCFAESVVRSGNMEFSYGCKSASVCRPLMEKAMNETAVCSQSPDGCMSRRTNPCIACCGDGGCNYGECWIMIDRLYMLYQRNLWSPNTLTQGAFVGR